MTLYETLGIQYTEDIEVIKKAYRKKAFEYHPDTNHGDKEKEELFKKAKDAYETLTDMARKREYDKSIRWEPSESKDFLQESPGSDVEVAVSVTFMESYTGTVKSVTIEDEKICDSCNGSGCPIGSSTSPCYFCNTTGYTKDIFGIGYKKCAHCRGRKFIIRDPCLKCKTKGLIASNRAVEVKIPPGVQSGMRLKFSGLGRRGEPNGDLIIMIDVSAHPKFQRSGNDLVFEHLIPLDVMILGGKYTIKTPDEGTYEIVVPPASQCNTLVEISGKGFRDLNHHMHGNMVVIINPELPRGLTLKGQDMLSELMLECRNHNLISR